jgi:hypothetical protein
MKRFRFLILIVVLLVIAAVILIIRSATLSTLDENTNFAIQDTSSVTRVFLADKNNNKVLLSRNEDGSWTVNDKYKASFEAVRAMLKTVMSLEIKSPVPQKAHNNIVKILATTATKVEIYQTVYRIDLFGTIRLFPHEKKTRTYYVGFATQDNLGTYMLMEGADAPYIVAIPGFNGFLTTRYSPYEKDWRDHSIFNYGYPDIRSVTLWFPETPEKSFRLSKSGPRDFKLMQINDKLAETGSLINAYDTLKVMDYFAGFQNIRFESLLDDLDKRISDSIRAAVPFHILTIEDVRGNASVIKTYHMQGAPDVVDLENKPVLWDRDRLYALINNGNDLVLIQFYVFDPILRPLDHFITPGKGDQGQ